MYKMLDRFGVVVMTCGSRLLIVSLNRLQLSDMDNGGEKMKYEKIETQGLPFLTRELVKGGVKVVRIITEPKLETVTFKDKKTGQEKTTKKYVCIASTKVDEPKQVTWQMNPTTSNYLDETMSPISHDTKDWMNKDIELTVKQAGSSEPGIYPKNCSLEKVIA